MARFSVQDSTELYLTAVTEAELRAGLAMLRLSQRLDRLATEVDAVVRENIAGRVPTFDGAAVGGYATITSARRSLGRPALRPIAGSPRRETSDLGISLVHYPVLLDKSPRELGC